MAPVHPNSMLWNAGAKVDSSQLLGPMLHLNTLWRRLSRAHTLCSERSLLTSFLYNPRMPAGLTHQMSSPWATRDLFHFGHLVHPCTRRLLPFAELKKKFGIPKQAFCGYLQIRHYAQSIAPDLQFSTPTTFEGLILEGSARRGLISDIYQVLNSYNFQVQGKHTYMLRWEKYIGEEIPENTWQVIWSQAAKSSLCTLYKENAYKILFFWYMMPDVLRAIYPSSSDRCWRCYRDKGTLYHIYWSCPKIVPFWTEVQSLLTRLLGVQVPWSPKLFLFGVSGLNIPRHSRKLMGHIITAARCLVALRWKKQTPPTQSDLYTRIKDVELMEKMTARIQDRLEIHDKVWEDWQRREDPP